MLFLLMLSQLATFFQRRGRIAERASSPSSEDLKTEDAQVVSESQELDENKSKMSVSSDSEGFATCLNNTNSDIKTIKFQDENGEFCQDTIGKNIEVICSSSCTYDHGSSHVKLRNFVDYKWEVKDYQGHLITVHRDGILLAYGINVTMGAQREGMVRAVDRSCNSRALIKGMYGEVLDLQFANLSTERLLAAIDHVGLYVYNIISVNGNLGYNPVIKISDPIKAYTPVFDRIAWCPFNKRKGFENDDETHLIGWVRGSNVQLFYIKNILKDVSTDNNYHHDFIINPKYLSTGYVTLSDNSDVITWMGIAPDGTTMAVARTDGSVAFHQVYKFEKESRRLHQWVPHDGKLVSSIFFLENLEQRNEEVCLKNVTAESQKTNLLYWTYAITAANNNTEFKVWDISKWECFQKINFIVDPEKKPFFVAEMDRTANYLIISSYEERLLYVLEIGDLTEIYRNKLLQKACENKNSAKENGASTQSYFNIKRIAEFPLSAGILSFAVVSAFVDNAQTSNDNFEDDEIISNNTVKIHMFIIQAKSVQECNVTYEASDVDDIESSDYLTRVATIAAGNSLCSKSVNSEERIIGETTPRLSFLHRPTQNIDSSIIAFAAAAACTPSMSEPESMESQSVASEDFDIKAALSGLTCESPSRGDMNDVPVLETTINDREQVNPEVYNTIQMLADFAIKSPKADNSNTPQLPQALREQIQQQHQAQKKSIEISAAATAWLNEGCNLLEQTANSRSSNSSPSREVQDILSNKEMIADELDEIITDSPDPAVDDAIEIDLHSQAPLTPRSNNHEQQTGSDSYTKPTKIWPVPIESLLESRENRDHIFPKPISDGLKPSDSKEINKTMLAMIESMRDLTKEVSNLRKEVHELKTSQKQESNSQLNSKTFSEFAFKLEIQISKLLEQYLKRYDNEHNKRLTAFAQQCGLQNREFRENLINITNQHLLRQFSDMVTKALNLDIQRKLTPIYAAKLDVFHKQIEADMIQKLNKIDGIVKENLIKACNNKQFIDVISKGIISGMRGNMQIAFTESMSKALIPAYEKSSASMFNQLQGTFTSGVREILSELEKRANITKTANDVPQDLIVHFSNFKKQMEMLMNKQSSILTEAMIETCKEIKGIEFSLSQQIREVINTELQEVLANQSFALGSKTNAAPAVYDIRDNIKLLLSKDEINKAFHTALLANDLNVVEFTLQQIDHSTVFSPKSRLEQKVLISLIQQISMDMRNHNDLKQNYLAEAVLALVPNDPITKEHAPKVLAELYRNCQEFCTAYPKSTLATSVRMLLMGAQNRFAYQF